MKAEELMIGDYVKFPTGNDRIEVLPYFKGKGMCASFLADGTFHPVSISKLEPILITDEILVKNGFRYKEEDEYYVRCYPRDGHFCKDMNMYIGTDDNGYYRLYTYANDIQGLRYVHELQHALRLCSVEIYDILTFRV